MNFGSFCSGIGAPEVAWSRLGWRPLFFSEIDPFASAVLAERFPGVPNLGDMEKIDGAEIKEKFGPIDLLVAGTPCQSFSVAGLRKGMADPRGNLALVFLRLVDAIRPRWLVWENVPGVLSSWSDAEACGDGSRWQTNDFDAFTAGIGELGYGVAWRILDAQYAGVPQRRRRVFVVGHPGDWRRAAAVLFERHSLSGDSPPGREKGKGVAGTAPSRVGGGGGFGTDFEADGGLVASTGEISHCLNAGGNGRRDFETETLVAHTLRGEGFDANEDGTGRGSPLVPVSYRTSGNCGVMEQGDKTAALTTNTDPNSSIVAYQCQGSNVGPSGTLRRGGGNVTSGVPFINKESAVRRLTPLEYERLQGFPDHYTLVQHRGKPAKDRPRYKAVGNSIAVPVIEWIGRRIEKVEAVGGEQ